MNNKAFIVAGMGFGDEGKGTIVDYLARKYNSSVVVRYNGASQAAHHVVIPDGTMHCFSQFGAGTFVKGAKTFLSKFMLIDPLAIIKENDVLQSKGIKDGLERMTIDERCIVITPFHKIINRMLEITRGNNRHGSCGMGVGQAVSDEKQLGDKVLYAQDLLSASVMNEKLKFLQYIKIDIAEQIQEENPDNRQLSIYLQQIKRPDYIALLIDEYIEFSTESDVKIGLADNFIYNGNIIFEGAQGALLDVDYGFWPHITMTCTTFENAEKLISSSDYFGTVSKIGVIRAYGTRHGAGPFVTEDKELTGSIPDAHNGANEWQGRLRVGWLDLLAVRYAIEISGRLDSIALTNLDRLSGFKKIKVCVSYEHRGTKTDLLDKYFEWELTSDKKIKITRLKKVFENESEKGQFAKLLFNCFPLEFKEFQGWKTDLSNIARFEDLPKQARAYINFFQSKEGLDIPISIISIGPAWTDKIEL